MYKICLYVPETHLESVKAALFAAGAGRIGRYEACSWQVRGEGQFRPQEGAKPFLGQVGQVEVVAEYKVELVCADDYIAAAIRALREAHPYEEPAYDVVKLLDL